jgi:hypothetical protein
MRYLLLDNNRIAALDISVLFGFENLESLSIDPLVTLSANHKLQHQNYFPKLISERLSSVKWMHESGETALQ